jgi:hypothetical protein
MNMEPSTTINDLLDVIVISAGGDEDATGLAASSTCTSSTCCSIVEAD